MDPALQEVIFETWLYKYQEGRHTLRVASGWKRRYIILLRHGNRACVQYYEKKPLSLEDLPKGRVELDIWFMVTKRSEYRGRRHVCEVNTGATKPLILSTEEENMFHLLSFFLQTQIKLREESETCCFVVRPDGSDDHMKLGSRGSMCLLHVSKGGITLALQLSRCVLTQWPLSCIKLYDGEMRGQFLIETGKNAPAGMGKYIFNTRHDEHKTMYDLMDAYVMELAGLKEIAMERTSSQTDTMESLISQQYTMLQELVVPESDPRFISHLKKVSRGIYDQLAEHLGATSHSRLDVSSSEPAQEDGPPMMRFAPKRSVSQNHAHPKVKLKSDDFNSMSLGRRQHKPPSPLQLKAGPIPKLRNKSPLVQPIVAAAEAHHKPTNQHGEGHYKVTNQQREAHHQLTNQQGEAHHQPTNQQIPRDDVSSQYIHTTRTSAVKPSQIFDEDQYVEVGGDAQTYYNTDKHHEAYNQDREVTERSQPRSPEAEYTRMSNEPNRGEHSNGNYGNGNYGNNSYGNINYGNGNSHNTAFSDYSKARGSMDNLRLSDLSNGRDDVDSPNKSTQPKSKIQVAEAIQGELYQDMTGSPPKTAHNAKSKMKSRDYSNYGNRSLRRQHSRSLEDLTLNYAQMSGGSNTDSASVHSSVVTNIYGNQDMGPLRRQHSRSCEDLTTEYIPMTSSPVKAETGRIVRPKVLSKSYNNSLRQPHVSGVEYSGGRDYAVMSGSLKKHDKTGAHWSIRQKGSLECDIHGVAFLNRAQSSSCEDLAAEYADMSGEFVSYENNFDQMKKSARPKIKSNFYGNTSLSNSFERHLSRSCDDLSSYADMSGDMSGEQITYENMEPNLESDKTQQMYAYARPSDLDFPRASDLDFSRPSDIDHSGHSDLDSGASYRKILRDKSALYTKPIPKEFRRSQSLSNMMGVDVEPPVRPKISQKPTNTTILKAENDAKLEKLNRPDNFDFGKMNQSTPKSASRQTSATSEGSHQSESYMQVGNSKFWDTSIVESPTKVMTPLSLKGISMTSETRVFSRTISENKQPPVTAGGGSRMEQPLVTDGGGGRMEQPLVTGGGGGRMEQPSVTAGGGGRMEQPSVTGGGGGRMEQPQVTGGDGRRRGGSMEQGENRVELRRDELSTSSMRGRRLPSLPPDAHVTVPGLTPNTTVC